MSHCSSAYIFSFGPFCTVYLGTQRGQKYSPKGIVINKHLTYYVSIFKLISRLLHGRIGEFKASELVSG